MREVRPWRRRTSFSLSAIAVALSMTSSGSSVRSSRRLLGDDHLVSVFGLDEFSLEHFGV
jgi:hypothetical protein